MKINFDKKKGSDALAAIAKNTADISKKVAEGVKSGTVTVVEKTKVGATAVVERTKSDAYARRLKKFNPLFPDKYHDESFHLPNIIVIVDDAVRKDIDVCEGAIGWLGKEKDVEILYLYDEAVPFSGIQFIPVASCDAVYYVDSFDRHSFIKADCYFEKIQEEKTAELEHIAGCLGAKWCSVEMVNEEKTSQAKEKKVEVKERANEVQSTESAEQSSAAQSESKLHRQSITEFKGNNVPQKPALKWFAHDHSIQQLIADRCSGNNAVVKKEFRFNGSSFNTMSQKAACAIDSALVAAGGACGSASMEAQVTKEQKSKMVFLVEF